MYDWAIVHLSSGAPVPHLGWWYDTNDSHLAGWYEYVNGYPGCGMSDSPAGCTYATEYTSSGCFAGRFYNYDSASGVQVNRNYYIGCATSPGESGAPFFSYSACSGCGPLIVGVSITGHCVGTQCQGNPTPNTAVRIDPWLSNTMASLQSMYP